MALEMENTMQTLAIKLSLNDQHLVRLAREGDNEAFGELIRRHWNKCVDLATAFLRNRGDAEDEVQNAFSKAYAHLDQYHGEAEFSTWLTRIVTNQCLMFMRVKRRTRFVYLDDAVGGQEAAPVELPACGPDPEGEFAFGQMKTVLSTEIRRIPPMLRNVMLLRDIQELPIGDVARQLGITIPAAKSRLLRARTELRSRLLRHAEKSGSFSPLARSAAPLNRVAHHRAMRPLMTANA
jgi:RNA polymerase sigma-70 factor (ECF subfamily)